VSVVVGIIADNTTGVAGTSSSPAPCKDFLDNDDVKEYFT
jgi:hypothetical protein